MRLKVCGMRELENISALSELDPNYIGFIFWSESSRFVDKKTPPLDKKIIKTGVFVDATFDYILTKIKDHQLDAVQLHGQESCSYCKVIKDYGLKVIKSFSLKNTFDFNTLEDYENSCDYYLFDTKGKLPGGNGFNFDWKILNEYPSQKPFFLSGGIGVDNLNEIKKLVKTKLPLHAIDVNSKFETAPGNKNIELLKKFKKEIDEL
ncbi:MAG: N-(5'-phosphoribosyl)anthranilate isomerase [Flavobacteriaceae bacterium]|nr:N-(5'-phosphoribosyl)anthranilate isomerase [Flavobacteriaceae bacterium]